MHLEENFQMRFLSNATVERLRGGKKEKIRKKKEWIGIIQLKHNNEQELEW